MAIKRIIVEVNVEERPFQAEETLFSYAQRILQEDGLSGMIAGISTRLQIIDVSTYQHAETIGVGQIMGIEVRTSGVVR